MGNNKGLLVFMALCICLACFLCEVISWGRLKNPGLSESEIRRGWKDFEDIKDNAQPQGDYPFMALFKKAAQEYDLPLPLILAMARGESNFDHKASSVKDCYGIMQIKWPDTANDLGITRKSDLFVPRINIDAGARYLSGLLKRFNNNTYLAVAAYNYGPNAVSPQRVPEGAQWYAAYIHRHLQFVLYERYEDTRRLLVLEFTFYNNAVEFMTYLEKAVQGVPFEIFKSRKYTYDIYLTYKTSEERAAYLKRLKDKTLIEPLEVKRSKGEIS